MPLLTTLVDLEEHHNGNEPLDRDLAAITIRALLPFVEWASEDPSALGEKARMILDIITPAKRRF